MELKVDHLMRDKKSALLTYRRRFPQELVPYIPSKSPKGSGRKELKVSLKASSMNDPVARARYDEADRLWGEIVDKARKKASGTYDKLDADTISGLASIILNEGMAIDAEVRLEPEPTERKRQRAVTLAQTSSEDLADWRELRALGDIEEMIAMWGYEAESLAEAEGYLVDRSSASFAALCNAINDAQISAAEGILERLKGNLVPTPEIALRPKKTAQSNRTKQSVLGLYEKYAAVPDRNPKTIAQWRRYILHLVDFVGSDDLQAFTHDDLVSWRNHLRDQVTYKGKRLSAKTINGSYLGAANALFGWAKGDGIIALNPMREVTNVSLPKKPRIRSKMFTRDETILILQSSMKPSASREGEDLRNAKRWCPWLMAYSGARVNEITQLRKVDIFEQEGIWVMRITPEAGSVKGKEPRLVPLHSHLRDQGFLKFVQGRHDGPLFYDPTRRRSDHAINRQANRLGSKLAEWVRSLGLEGVMPNHAWRHYFSSAAVRYELDPRVTKAITGHSSSDVHDKTYLEGLPDFVDVLSREIEKIPRFEVLE